MEEWKDFVMKCQVESSQKWNNLHQRGKEIEAWNYEEPQSPRQENNEPMPSCNPKPQTSDRPVSDWARKIRETMVSQQDETMSSKSSSPREEKTPVQNSPKKPDLQPPKTPKKEPKQKPQKLSELWLEDEVDDLILEGELTPDENDLDRLRFAKRSPPRRHEKSTDRVNS